MTTEFANCAVPEVLGRIVLQLLVDYLKFTSLGVTRLFMRERGARQLSAREWRRPVALAPRLCNVTQQHAEVTSARRELASLKFDSRGEAGKA